MGRREQARLEGQGQGLDDESERSFVTNQSQLEVHVRVEAFPRCCCLTAFFLLTN